MKTAKDTNQRTVLLSKLSNNKPVEPSNGIVFSIIFIVVACVIVLTAIITLFIKILIGICLFIRDAWRDIKKLVRRR
jgi:hypothetical protein